MNEGKYERDGFLFKNKSEYYKYLIISLLLVITYVALLILAFTYPIKGTKCEFEYCCMNLCK